MLELRSALDATILNAGNEVTQLVARARKNLETVVPKTVTVSRMEQIRVPAKNGQVGRMCGALAVNNALSSGVFLGACGLQRSP